MTIRVRDVTLLKTNLNGLFFGVLTLAIVPVFCCLVYTRPAGALSPLGLVRDVTGPLQQLLSSQPMPVAPPPPPHSTVPTSSSPTPTAPVSPAPAVSEPHRLEVAASSQQSAPPEIGVYGAPLETVDALSGTLPASRKLPQAKLATVQQPTSGNDRGVLQATDQGWLLLGVLWYWWLSGAVAACAIAWLVCRWRGGHVRE